MRITSSDLRDNLGRPGKKLITSLGLKAKERPKKHKKARYTIGNVEAPSSCNNTIYLSWLIHLEKILGGKAHR